MSTFPDGSLTVAFNPTVVATIQDRTLQRVFRDSLFPRLLYRMEAAAELWPVAQGTNQTFTRTGLIKPTTRPIKAGVDPTPKTYKSESWEAFAQQFADAIDTNMPTSYVTLASQYLRNMHVLGMHAGQSLNRVVRDKIYNAYVAGNTVTDAAALINATTIHVANLTGLTSALLAGRPAPVSASNPINITIPSIAYVGQITAASPDVAGDPIHGGTLTISPGLGAALPSRSAVLAAKRSQVLYSGGGTSVDDVSSVDHFAMRDVRGAVAQLRFNNVPPHEDGTYHCHLDPTSENQAFEDNEFQRVAGQSLPDYIHYKRFALASFLGVTFYRNNEAPFFNTCDADPDTGATHGFELVNGSSVNLHRPIFTGQGVVEEKYLDESRYISEAGVQGRIGEFSVTNGGVQVMTERIRLVLRAPQDRLQQNTSSAWSFSGDWPIPTDELAPGSGATYRRAVVLVHGE
jgi:hypothetical protein